MQVNEIIWKNCYEGSWKGVIVPEAFSHPAKMSYSLLKRILAHAKEQGWIKEGGVIVDPFGGIGSTGILGAYEGYQVVCCELEQKFVDLAEQNFKLHDNAWRKLDCPRPIMIQGDSRRLCEIVDKADLIVSSPPYQESNMGECCEGKARQVTRERAERESKTKYGQTPGQLGAMKSGDADMVISSPPFGEVTSDKPSKSIIKGGLRMGASSMGDGYGQSKGNLGNLKSGDADMVISSPPYAESLKGDGTEQETYKETRKMQRQKGGPMGLGQSQRTQGYGSKENLGNLKSGQVDAILSSPPYEEGIGHGGNPTNVDKEKALHIADSKRYSDTKENLGNQRGDTFWSAAKLIIEQCYQILKPGGHAIWVVKSFVRNKKIVDFPGDWQGLCEAVGFKTVCIHHAMLVKETKHKTLFGDIEVKRKERKSFFRRLAESHGSPRIDFEVVLCMLKE